MTRPGISGHWDLVTGALVGGPLNGHVCAPSMGEGGESALQVLVSRWVTCHPGVRAGDQRPVVTSGRNRAGSCTRNLLSAVRYLRSITRRPFISCRGPQVPARMSHLARAVRISS